MNDARVLEKSRLCADLFRRLRDHFGFRRFRPGQEQVVQAALDGRDALVIMPTGSGKSLCFQLPGLVMEGATLVVSPLIALMKDQDEGLRSKGVDVVVINSTMSAAERREAEDSIAASRTSFIYTTPEQLADPEFRALLHRAEIALEDGRLPRLVEQLTREDGSRIIYVATVAAGDTS